MPSGDTCDRCGAPVGIGDYPFCPHGRSAIATVPDDIPGGMIVENGFETPTRFDSRSAHRAALAARGLEIGAKYAGPLDRHLTNWAAGIDPYTLEAARALVTRGSR